MPTDPGVTLPPGEPETTTTPGTPNPPGAHTPPEQPTAAFLAVEEHHSAPEGKALAAVALAALGVVFGDIGTSPLYALQQCVAPRHGVSPTPENILGLLSLVVWSLLMVVTVKYLIYVMRADNRGDGGVLALLGLLQDPAARAARRGATASPLRDRSAP